MLIGDFTNRLQIGALAVEMNGNDRLGFGSDCGFNFGWIDTFGFWITINKNSGGPGDPDRFGGGEESVCMRDDFVPGAHSERHESEPDGVGSIAQADGVFSAMVGSEFGFKVFKHGAHDVLAALEYGMDILINLRFDVMVLPDVTVEFYFHAATRY